MKPAAPATAAHATAVRSIVDIVVGSGLGTQAASENTGAAFCGGGELPPSALQRTQMRGENSTRTPTAHASSRAP